MFCAKTIMGGALFYLRIELVKRIGKLCLFVYVRPCFKMTPSIKIDKFQDIIFKQTPVPRRSNKMIFRELQLFEQQMVKSIFTENCT